MKQVALLLLVAFSLSGCSNPTVTQQAQSAAAGIWSAEIEGGDGSASGFSFTTEFTINGGGGLNITYFQFLNTTNCFPVDGQNESGTMVLNSVNPSTGQTVGTFTYKVQASGNTLTLKGNVAGTEVNGVPPLSAGTISGTWTLTGGSGCNNSTSFPFTMTQGSSSTTTTSTGSSGT
ncbi:MAG: hypothetical protein WA824_18070 [Candidatus Sulfotelmatobacter sp.]